MQKYSIYFKITSNLRVYLNFSNENEIKAGNSSGKKAKQLVFLSRFQARFAYGLVSYLNDYLQFRNNFFSNINSEWNISSCKLNIIFLNVFDYDLIIKQW